MKHREKPKYSVRQNVCFMVRTAWEKRRRVLLLCVVVAAIKVALDLAQLYVTPEILTRVEQGVPVGELLTTIGFFTAALLLLQGAAAYCDAIRMPGEVDVRCAIIRMISRKSGETSYPNVHDSKILKLEEQAQRATSGNDDAAEHIWRTLTELLANLGGFAVYLLLFSRLSRFLILLVVLTAAADFFVSHYISEWEYRHRDEREQYDKELHYFLTQPRQIQLAKDIRVFGLAPWLRELREKSMKALSAFIARLHHRMLHLCHSKGNALCRRCGRRKMGHHDSLLCHRQRDLRNSLPKESLWRRCSGIKRRKPRPCLLCHGQRNKYR